MPREGERYLPAPIEKQYVHKMGLTKKYLYHDKNIFFITTTCYKWIPLLRIGDSMNIVSASLTFCANKYKATILGYVLMPNHIHLIANFAQGIDRINFMRDFKKFTSTKIRQEVGKYAPNKLPRLRYSKGAQVFKVWETQFYEAYLVSRGALESVLRYIHNNPLQEHWKLARNPKDYPYSSAGFYSDGNQRGIPVRHYVDYL